VRFSLLLNRAQRAARVAACVRFFLTAHNAPLKPAALCAFYCASVLREQHSD